ncbi:MAG: hypothetical protein GWQ08_15690 [Verrucomicrobiaceae bacterium]|nr:hypothetical protein [Verrucomicrobiaceae bacterium]
MSITLLLIAGTLPSHAQIAGEFVIPAIRTQGETYFAYWDLFSSGSDGTNYDFNNAPGLLSGTDTEGNVGSLAEGLSFKQTGSPNAFITSSGAIYDFRAPTAFEVELIPAEDEPFTNVIFQTMTGGRRLDLDDIRLEYELPDGKTASLEADFKALDDPATGQFSERLIAALQWDLTGLAVTQFILKFASSGGSMPIWEAQLDTVQAHPFVQELGYLLLGSNLPRVREGPIGAIIKDLPDDEEQRFHRSGASFDLLAEPEPGFEHVGWVYQEGVTESEAITVTFAKQDEAVTAVFAPLLYDDWRNTTFLNFSSHTGQEADNLSEEISGLDADFDDDGLTNLVEYAFGADPYNKDADLAVPYVIQVGEMLELSYYRQAALDEESDLVVVIQTSDDLITWENGDAFTLVSSNLALNGLREMVYQCPMGEHATYHRLHVSLTA